MPGARSFPSRAWVFFPEFFPWGSGLFFCGVGVRAPVLRLSHQELIVDSFAGGGGASLGIERGLGRCPDIAINHDPEAIAMHAANHPTTRHYCEDVWKVDPREACRGRPVGLAWFSPDCKHFSKAKGGKPVDKKIRGLAWIVIRWAKAVRPRVICLENVEEFEDWGPLLDTGKPCPERIGLTFRIWVGKLKALGYAVEWRELVAADYGTPTTRKRLFLVARRDGLPIVWPTPTHGRGLEPWRTAAECIDWLLPTYSIFLTKEEAKPYKIVRPLADNTMRRIARGLKKFVIDNPEPFIVQYHTAKREGDDRVASVRAPLPTQTTENRFGLATPFVAPLTHQGSDRIESLEEPMRTVTGAHRGEKALITPYLAGVGGRKGQSPETGVDRPYHTITAKGDTVLIAPTLITQGYGERPGQEPRAPGLQKPLGTIVGTQHHALVAAFLAKHYGGHETPGSPLGKAIDTVTAKDHNALVTSHLTNFYTSNSNGGQGDLFAPLNAITAQGNHQAEVRAFLTKFYGTRATGLPLESPLHTITPTERFGIVTVHGEPYVVADIGMRMLAPRELYRAQGFPDSYVIDLVVDGRRLPKDAQVRMVGNSVCPPLAAAIARAQFEDQVVEVAA